MNAGMLKQKIRVYEETTVINENGFKETLTEEVGVFRCYAEHLSTRERYRLEKLNLTISIKFTIRSKKDVLNERQKIEFEGEVYTINYFEGIYENSNYMTIYCTKFGGK